MISGVVPILFEFFKSFYSNLKIFSYFYEIFVHMVWTYAYWNKTNLFVYTKWMLDSGAFGKICIEKGAKKWFSLN